MKPYGGIKEGGIRERGIREGEGEGGGGGGVWKDFVYHILNNN